jgi:hypothetical protein
LKAGRPKGMRAGRLVAVVVPVARFPLTADEEISVRHLRKYLGGFDRYIIGPQRLPKEFSDFKLKRFPAQYFTGVYEYNRLLLTEEFYRAFAAYEYILIYQLDCLVFASNLDEWCRKGWDYVGAPWLKNMANPEEGFSAVGNGGLSLRRVRSALAVFRSKTKVPDEHLRRPPPGRLRSIYDRINPSSPLRRFIRKTKTVFHFQSYKNNVPLRAQQVADRNYHEDYFWSYEARRYAEDFRIPEPVEALPFSFETAPRYCLTANSGRMPFGCHAWTKYDRTFWEPFLLPPSD